MYSTPISVSSSETIYARACDVAGNSSTGSFNYVIDTSAPTATVAYDITSPTNGSVTATITPNKSVTVTNNGGLLTYTFTSNGSFTFQFIDSVGNTGSVTATVNNIDTTPPGTPTVTPSAGSYNTTQSVTLSSSGSDSIRYSISSTPADCSSGTLYSTPISVSSSETIYARACDTAGNSSTGSFIYTIDSVVPDISSISSDGTPTITWTTTKLSSSIIDYGLTNNYGTTTTETDTSPRVTSHSVTIPNLSSCTTYHYRIQSIDGVSNEATSLDQTLTTNGCTASSVQTDNVTSQINNTTGGSLSLPDITVTVPASFSSQNANFQIHQLDKTTVISQTSVPSGYLSAGTSLYELKSLADNTTVISSFDAPISVSIPYTQDDITGLDESTLKIYRWDNSSWNQLSSCSVDTSHKIVSCTTNHFSVFGIFGLTPKKNVSSISSGGSSVQNQVANLLANGNKQSSDDLMNKFPSQFPNQQTVVAMAPVSRTFIFTKTLKLKMTSPDVKELQKFLNSKGYLITKKGAGSKGYESNYFGTSTKKALMKYQKANKLKADGILGLATRKLMNKGK